MVDSSTTTDIIHSSTTDIIDSSTNTDIINSSTTSYIVHSNNNLKKKSLVLVNHPNKNDINIKIYCKNNNNKLIITEKKIADKEFGNIYFNKFTKKSLLTTQYKKN